MRFRVLLVVLALVAFSVPIGVAAGTNAWSAWSGPAAQIVDVAISTSAANEIYAISKNAVFRSNDGGSTWQSLAAPGGSELNDIAVESWPTTRLYVANYAGQGQPGLYRSDDVGQSWQAVFSGDPPAISKVTVSDDPPGRVTIGGDDRFPSSHYAILQSDDRGATWREVYRAQSTFGAGAITTLAPYGNSVLAGTLVYHGGGLLRVPSEGATFLEGSRPQNGFSTPGTIATGRTAAYPIYVQWTANGPFVLASLRKSSDGGQSWQDVTPPLQGNSGEQATQSGPHLTALAVDPAHPNIVLVAANWADAAGRPTVGVLMSRDGGATWAQLGGALPVARIGALAYSEARQSVYAATDQGVWQYTISAPPPSSEIAPWFRAYYDAHDGFRLLGRPLAAPGMTGRYPSQLFEKGRVEDHSAEESDPNWRIMYGLLVDEIIDVGSTLPVGGDRSSVTYAGLAGPREPSQRLQPPAGLTQGVQRLPNGSVFVPFDAQLRVAPGHTIPPMFWNYINDTHLFPGGWLHDIGLPITEPMTAVVDKGEARGRTITIQAFQRTILTYDSLNPPAWQVERANVGSDYRAAFGGSR